MVRQLVEFVCSHRENQRETKYFTNSCLYGIAGRLRRGAQLSLGFPIILGATAAGAGRAAARRREQSFLPTV